MNIYNSIKQHKNFITRLLGAFGGVSQRISFEMTNRIMEAFDDAVEKIKLDERERILKLIDKWWKRRTSEKDKGVTFKELIQWIKGK